MPRIMPSLLLARFLRFRSQFFASALPAARCPYGVPRVALHADHLDEEPFLGLREPRHGENGTRSQYLSKRPKRHNLVSLRLLVRVGDRRGTERPQPRGGPLLIVRAGAADEKKLLRRGWRMR